MITKTRRFVFDWWVVQKRVVYLLVTLVILCGLAGGTALYVWKYGNPLRNVGTGVKLPPVRASFHLKETCASSAQLRARQSFRAPTRSSIPATQYKRKRAGAHASAWPTAPRSSCAPIAQSLCATTPVKMMGKRLTCMSWWIADRCMYAPSNNQQELTTWSRHPRHKIDLAPKLARASA